MGEIGSLNEWEKALNAAGGDEERLLRVSGYLEKFGIKVDNHALRRIIERGLGIKEIVETFRDGGLYYDEGTRKYVRFSREHKLNVVVDGDRIVTSFHDNKPANRWNKVPGKR